MAQGLIIVEVYRHSELFPIMSAEVTITSEETGATRELLTDENGHTRMVSLPAPPRQASLTPDSNQVPFYRYTVSVQAEGYVPVKVVGVQVFPGIESIVPVHMFPKERDGKVVALPASAAIVRGTDFFPEFTNDEVEEEILIVIPENAVMTDFPREQVGPPDVASEVLYAQAQLESAKSAPAFAMMPAEESGHSLEQTPGREAFVWWDSNRVIVDGGYQIHIPDSAVMHKEGRRHVGPDEHFGPDEPFAPGERLSWHSPAVCEDARPAFLQAAAIHEAGRVHQSVYVPEVITVHLGPPTSPARDVDVSFLDYIKNVASSEIFPTWPENALRANIHAQVGFALNRIFTEWYRRRGYAFDITNTTAYDQAFVEGRNIFENISQIVDEIFNVYPRREGRINPLFSAYCNGTTSTCEGLSQWGTVTLAEQGYSPLEILRHYYGNDVELAIATDIRSDEGSCPGYALMRGSEGDAVRSIQRQLIRISKNFPYIPNIPSSTGYFDMTTEAAVRAFQEIFDLHIDGVVGPATWYEIGRVYMAITGLGELNSEGLPLPGATAPYPGHNLEQGASGEDVRTLQRYLNDLSSVYGSLPAITIDGKFGPGTTDAVINFQRLFGMVPDGIVGREAWAMLMLVWNNSF